MALRSLASLTMRAIGLCSFDSAGFVLSTLLNQTPLPPRTVARHQTCCCNKESHLQNTLAITTDIGPLPKEKKKQPFSQQSHYAAQFRHVLHSRAVRSRSKIHPASVCSSDDHAAILGRCPHGAHAHARCQLGHAEPFEQVLQASCTRAGHAHVCRRTARTPVSSHWRCVGPGG